jgi:NADH-quinone oxidoreductase subunit D
MVEAGVSGPNVRASGVNYDVRWTHPYSVYDELDWEPAVEKPTSVKGSDCYDRYRVRMEEMRMSCRIILDAIEKIPGGRNTTYANGDEMILAKAPTRAPEGATGFSNYECTRGASQFYIQGGGDGRGKNPYRLSIRSPMFITIPFVAETMIGYKVADIPAIMGSFDPCIGETDR